MKSKLMLTKYQMSYLKVINSPFIHKKQMTINRLMLWVIIAAIPGIICQIYFFSSGVIYQILLAVITALITEASALQLQKLPIIPYLKDNSAAVTALLLAISIPPLSPWWVIVLGTVFAILIAKHVYGGLGQNLFNPAMVGYVVLLISFPIQMTSWLPPKEFQFISINAFTSLQIIFTGCTATGTTLNQLLSNFDNITQATPLDSIKTDLLTNSIVCTSWQIVNIAYLFGGIILIQRRIISWRIPVAFLTTILFCSLSSWLIMPTRYVSPMFHLFSGATMLGAFFIATDSVTAATTLRGHLIYGAIIGLLIWIIRVYGNYPDAIAFSVLLANMIVPLIDHYSQPRVYGHKISKV